MVDIMEMEVTVTALVGFDEVELVEAYSVMAWTSVTSSATLLVSLSDTSSSSSTRLFGVDGVSVDTPIYVLIVVPLSNSSAMMPL